MGRWLRHREHYSHWAESRAQAVGAAWEHARWSMSTFWTLLRYRGSNDLRSLWFLASRMGDKFLVIAIMISIYWCGVQGF